MSTSQPGPQQRYALLEGTHVDDVRIPMIGLGTWPMTGAECEEAVASAQVVLRRHVQQGRIAIPRSADPRRQRGNLDVFSFGPAAGDLAASDALDVSASGGRSANRADPASAGTDPGSAQPRRAM